MVPINFISLSLSVFILYTNLFAPSLSLEFNNLQSEKLSNGDFIFVHQYAIDIFNKDLTQIIRTEISFTEEEQITTEKMKNTIIKKFEDEYIICLVNDKIYIFDDLGYFLYKSDYINNGITANYYSLCVKDNYNFFIGMTSEETLYLYYYEYDKNLNITSKAASGEIQIEKTNLVVYKTYYTFISGLSCHYMYSTGTETGGALVCFLVLSKDNDNQWYIGYYYINSNLIKPHTQFSAIQAEMVIKVEFFKVEINSSKNKALICGFTTGNNDFCQNFDISQTSFNFNYIYHSTPVCLFEYYGFNVKYFSEKDEFVFNCLGFYNNKIKYVYYKLGDNSYSLDNYYELNETSKCGNINEYIDYYFYYSEKYYIFSHDICIESSDISQEIHSEKENEENTKNIEERKEEEELEEKENTINIEEQKEEEGEEEEEVEKKEENEYICELEKCSQCDRTSASQNLCQTCDMLKGYYPLKDSFLEEEFSTRINNYKDCFNNITKPSNYFLNILKNYYEPCFEACETCEYGGDKLNNNCISCDFGYISIPGLNNTFNCILKCPYYFYYTKYGQYKCSKFFLCPEDYYLLIRPKEQCIEDCSKDGEYKYQYNGECFKECPDNSSNSNNDYICLDNNINVCSLNHREISIKEEIITKEEKEILAKSYFKEFLHTDNQYLYLILAKMKLHFIKIMNAYQI